MVKQPLILSIMTLAYQGRSAEKIENESLNTIETRHKHLFDIYIQRMFERVARTKNESDSPEQTRRWLSWLAQNEWFNAVPYLIEDMQPEWLETTSERKVYRFLFGLIFQLILKLLLEYL